MGVDVSPGGCDQSDVFPYYKRLLANAAAFLFVDTIVLGCALLIGDVVLYYVNNIPISVNQSILIIPAWWAGAYFSKMLPGWGLGPVEEVRRLEILLVAVFGIASASLFLVRYGGTASRISFLISYMVCVIGVPLARVFCKRLLIARGRWGLPAVVYGNDHTVRYVIDVLRDEGGLGYNPIGIFDDETHVGDRIKDIPVLGTTDDRTDAAPCAILAAPSMPRKRFLHLLNDPLTHYRRVVIIPDLLEVPSLWVKPLDFMGILGLEITSNLLNPVLGFIKYSAEWLLVVVTLPVWLPVCVLVALAVWLQDSGNPFFAQKRFGKRGHKFTMLKFRTMRRDAEKVLKEQLATDEKLRAEWEQQYKLKDDPRITRLGRFLRISSLDELPQLFNVLVGQMALVGPRPLPRYHLRKLPKRVREVRMRVRPGITGLWQVSGRTDAGIDGMDRWDSYYVRNWSVWLDVVIMARTLRAVIHKHGAY